MLDPSLIHTHFVLPRQGQSLRTLVNLHILVVEWFGGDVVSSVRWMDVQEDVELQRFSFKINFTTVLYIFVLEEL